MISYFVFNTYMILPCCAGSSLNRVCASTNGFILLYGCFVPNTQPRVKALINVHGIDHKMLIIWIFLCQIKGTLAMNIMSSVLALTAIGYFCWELSKQLQDECHESKGQRDNYWNCVAATNQYKVCETAKYICGAI